MPTGHYKRQKMSEATKKKIGLSNKGKKPWSTGTHYSSTERECIICKEKFWKNNFAVKNGEGKYCSKKCYGYSKKGVLPKHLVGIVRKNTGKGVPKPRGEECPNWRGGKTDESKRVRGQIEHRLWRESVFARDNWTCQKCSKRDGKPLHPHHILNFSSHKELRFAIDNGITLHKECHTTFHKKFGYRNNTMEQIEEFLTQ